jgi:hypothetical protein
MEASGQGFEMAFYFSPLAFRGMDGILLIGAILGVVGAALGPRWYHRCIAVLGGLLCAGWFTQLPWR